MAGEFRASMLITAETGQARIAIGALRGETDQLGAAATKAGQAAKSGGAGFAADWRLSAEEARLYQAALDQVRAQYDPLFAASQRYEAELRQIAEAERLGAISAATAEAARARAAQSLTPMSGAIRGLGAESRTSAAYVSQLGFQLNDIIMMAAAGQNPLMLMMQQGSQVTQVFDGLRASGLSVGASIRSALLGILSPANLVTMGVIAVGTAIVQSFFGGEESIKSATEAVDDLESAVDSLGRVATVSVGDLRDRFGAVTREIVGMEAALRRVEGVRAFQAQKSAIAALQAETEGSWWAMFTDDAWSRQGQVANLLGTDWRTMLSAEGRPREVEEFIGAVDGLASARGPQEILAAYVDIRAQMEAATGGIEQMNDRQLEFYGTLVDSEAAMRRMVEESRKSALAQMALDRAAGTENVRMGGPTVLDRPAKVDPVKAAEGLRTANDLLAAGREEIELARLKAVYGAESAEVRAEEARQAQAAVEAKIRELGLDQTGREAQRMRGQEAIRLAQIEADRVAGRRQAADEMLAQFAAEARVNELSAKWGADSLEVAYARASAEREVYAAQLEAQGITGPLADDLMNAWDAARGIASINMAAGIAPAAAEALLLAQNLGVSLKTAAAIASMGMTMADGSIVKPGPAQPPGGGLSFGGTSGSLGGGLGGGAGLTYGANPGSAGSVAGIGVPGTGTGKGGGGGGAKAEADALEELLAREREQIAALKILDPVQAEIEKNHLALKDATDEEKLAVADLIAKRMKLEEIRDRLDEIGETGRSAFQQLLSGATSFGGAISMVLEKLAEMAASEAWDLIWGSGGLNLGGILGDLFGLGSAPAKADGGQVRGQGGPREDNLLHWLSAGEYVVNAAATAGALPLLEAINAGVPVHRLIDVIGGRRPAYADGGLVGGLVGDRAPAAWSRVTGGGSANEARAGGAAARQDRLEVAIHLDNDLLEARITDTSTGVASRVTRRGLEEFSAQALPARVRAIQAEPRRIG